MTVLSSDKTLDAAAAAMREDFEVAMVILAYAVQKNIREFRFSGLKIPSLVQNWQAGMPLPPPDSFAIEVSTFQEHLYDRIAGLAHNRQMLKSIWRFNERSRQFRELELCDPDAAREILDRLATLVNALFSRNSEAALGALDLCREHRFERMDWLSTLLGPAQG